MSVLVYVSGSVMFWLFYSFLVPPLLKRISKDYSDDRVALKAGMYVCYAAVPVSFGCILRLMVALEDSGVKMGAMASLVCLISACLVSGIVLSAMAISFRILYSHSGIIRQS